MRVTIERELLLFRYDLVKPEDNWSTHYHSVEYEYTKLPDIFRYKNQIGAFFFYFTREQAINTAKVACEKNGRTEFWLTETMLNPRLQLLDLRDRESHEDNSIELDSPVKIITYLFDLDIDILTKSFVKFEPIGKDSIVLTPFSIIRPQFEELNRLLSIHDADIQVVQKRYALANEINEFFHNHIGYFGQLLTDFTNGKAFKELMMNAGFDGYIFEEERETHIQTYCFFNADHLSAPQSERAYTFDN